MDKKKFRVIIGNKENQQLCRYTFVEAHVTNTRLMGVLGLRIKWLTEREEEFFQFFHLDAEEYGLDDYMGLLSPTEEQLDFQTAKMMGGLGGELVLVSERESRYLLREFVKKNSVFGEQLPEPVIDYNFTLKEKNALSKEEVNELWDKICEKVDEPIQLINYFIMRAVGADEEALRYLCDSGQTDYRVVEKSGTLLKSVTETLRENDEIIYLSESIIDIGSQYKMVLSELKVVESKQGYRIIGAEVRSSMNITAMEAAFGLTKPEYISIYYMNDREGFIQKLENNKPHAMKHAYEGSYLFTEFNPTNQHVRKPIYFLNEDVYGIYYITEEEQLLVGAYSQENIEALERYFEQGPFDGLVQLDEKLRLDRPLLYEFVQSDYSDFYDFLEDHQDS
ncbi:MAG: hypothetical protein AB2421_12185 [Thermotaleaceae bacterium]